MEIEMKLSGRTILITGGTSGIGLELARLLVAEKNTVIVTGRDEAKLEKTRSAVPGIIAIRSDVSEPTAIDALFDRVTKEFSALDMLINNAGIMRNLKLQEDRALDDISREIDTNLSGPVRMIQRFLPHLKSRPTAAIVNVSSGLAFVPFPAAPIYSATKAAMHAYTRSLRIQLKDTRVAVFELAPPGTDTPLFHDEFQDEVRGQSAMSPETLAKKALAALKADRPEIRPGLSNVLKAMSRIAPELMLNQLAKLSDPARR
jgi:uncharacterized oxidoreductase